MRNNKALKTRMNLSEKKEDIDTSVGKQEFSFFVMYANISVTKNLSILTLYGWMSYMYVYCHTF